MLQIFIKSPNFLVSSKLSTKGTPAAWNGLPRHRLVVPRLRDLLRLCHEEQLPSALMVGASKGASGLPFGLYNNMFFLALKTYYKGYNYKKQWNHWGKGRCHELAMSWVAKPGQAMNVQKILPVSAEAWVTDSLLQAEPGQASMAKESC